MTQTAELAAMTAIAVPELENVNKCVNRAQSKGDACEIAYLKRAMLIARGFEAEALLIADVRRRNGENHTVLLARTVDDLYVLDTLTDELLLREECPHTFVYLLFERCEMAEAA